MEIQRYLKTGSEFERGMELIQRNTDIVQALSTSVCGHLCLFVLKSLASGNQFQSILDHIQHYGYPQGDWKDSVSAGKRLCSAKASFHMTLQSTTLATGLER